MICSRRATPVTRLSSLRHLAAITATFHHCGVNIIEVQHQRIFTRLPAKDTVIEVECEARDARAIDVLVDALEEAGFKVERASLD